jgi:hypothetical protein
MVTGALPTDEKLRCQRFIQKKYGYCDGHATPIGKRIRLEVFTKDGIKPHNLKLHEHEYVEEYDTPMNDR